MASCMVRSRLWALVQLVLYIHVSDDVFYSSALMEIVSIPLVFHGNSKYSSSKFSYYTDTLSLRLEAIGNRIVSNVLRNATSLTLTICTIKAYLKKSILPIMVGVHVHRYTYSIV